LALLRDGTQAYVGLGKTDKIVAIDTSLLANNAITNGATTTITVGVHRSVTNSQGLVIETTTPTVISVAVSRGGNSADLSKAYAITTTQTTYNYFDASGNLTNTANYPDLYDGIAVVAAAANGSTPINTYITTIPTPSQVTYCEPGTDFDGQKNCPLMTPFLVLGRS
jgi:hypothetical protein